MRTTAVRKGDKWVINGSKCFITNGGYAYFFTVYAKTDKEKGHRGISCFIVPKDDTVTVDKKEDKMGQRASNTATITFNDTEIPLDHLIGEENKGFKIAMMTLDRTRPGVAAMATGIARAAFEFATAYSKERVQFGVPIAMHQAIQFLIADMATKVHLSRLAAWHSAVLLDQGKRNTLESSHAKRFAADSAMEVTTDAVQVYGGYGFIKDYPVEKLMRDAKIMQLYEGTSQIQRLVIARETLLPRRIEEPAAVCSRSSSCDDASARAAESRCGGRRRSAARLGVDLVLDRQRGLERRDLVGRDVRVVAREQAEHRRPWPRRAVQRPRLALGLEAAAERAVEADAGQPGVALVAAHERLGAAEAEAATRDRALARAASAASTSSATVSGGSAWMCGRSRRSVARPEPRCGRSSRSRSPVCRPPRSARRAARRSGTARDVREHADADRPVGARQVGGELVSRRRR